MNDYHFSLTWQCEYYYCNGSTEVVLIMQSWQVLQILFQLCNLDKFLVVFLDTCIGLSFVLFPFADMVKHSRWIGHMPIAVGRIPQVTFKHTPFVVDFNYVASWGHSFFFLFFFFQLLCTPLIFSLKSSGHFNIFVGDLSPEVTDATLFACFSVYPSCSWVPHCFFSPLLQFFLVTRARYILFDGECCSPFLVVTCWRKLDDAGELTFSTSYSLARCFGFWNLLCHLLSCYLQWCKGYVGSQNWSLKRIWFCFFPWPSGIAYSICWNILERSTNEPSWKEKKTFSLKIIIVAFNFFSLLG